jgi:hypothetical protein
MAGSHYIGKAGHLAFMGELCLRGYNVSMPEIDKGDDIFVVNDATGAMWRVQAKTSVGAKQKTSRRYQFRLRDAQITRAQNPELHYAFIMRKSSRWFFLIMDRAVLRNYVVNQKIGTEAKDYRQFTVVLHDDSRCMCSSVDLKSHIGDWNTWPKI